MKLFLLLNSFLYHLPLLSQEVSYPDKATFDKPILFLVFLIGVILIYRYLDDRKKKKRK